MKNYYPYYQNIYQELNNKTASHFSNTNSYTYKYSNLFNRYILNPYFLYYSYQKCRRSNRNSAPGIDGITIDDIEKLGAKSYIDGIYAELQDGDYQPSALLKSSIPKSNGKRTIYIPTLKDKIVQRAVTLVLNPIYETIFYELSMAFRPNRSQLDAIENTADFIESGLTYIIKTDIKSCFDNLNKELVLDNMDFIHDGAFLELVKNFFNPEIVDKDGNKQPFTPDIAQGTVVAPLLSNLALHSLDSIFINKYNSKNCRMIRYADDLLFLMKYPNPSFVTNIDSMLNQLGLQRNLNKTYKLRMRTQEPLKYLGYFFQIKQVSPMKLYLGPKNTKIKELLSNITKIVKEAVTNNQNEEVIYNDLKSHISSFTAYYRLSSDRKWLNRIINKTERQLHYYDIRSTDRFIKELRQNLFG